MSRNNVAGLCVARIESMKLVLCILLCILAVTQSIQTQMTNGAVSGSKNSAASTVHSDEHLFDTESAYVQSRPSAHLLNSVPTALPTSIRCPGGTMYNNRCFYLAGTARTWAGCQTHCSNNGWRMLCIDSATTNAFIKTTFSSYVSLWLGLNDRTTEGTYVWSGGCSPGNFRTWNDLQPDNYNDEDCIELVMTTSKWNDNDCAVTRGCGCESTWTAEPTATPTKAPTFSPTTTPTTNPSLPPSTQPTKQPSAHPTQSPTALPSGQPSSQPSKQPSNQPTRQPTSQPTRQPSTQPSRQPSRQPSVQPTRQPTARPSSQPSSQPTNQPSPQPSNRPSARPSLQPSLQPTRQPNVEPSSQPSGSPSCQPSRQPTKQPTTQPSTQPSSPPSGQPSGQPSSRPTQPTSQPSGKPSSQPSHQPTGQPSQQPISRPSAQPSRQPSSQPTQPTSQPSARPSVQPTNQPTSQPTRPVTARPSKQPTTPAPQLPTSQPSSQPSAHPSEQPSSLPSTQPSLQPTRRPTRQPSAKPSRQPSAQPSSQPSSQPSNQPSVQPTRQPSLQPSRQPSSRPSKQPSNQPTRQPTSQPTRQPTTQPSFQPTVQPSRQPTAQPSGQPAHQPSAQPSLQPSTRPSSQPTTLPTEQPTSQPSSQPSAALTVQPSGQPSVQPSTQPSSEPTVEPTGQPSAQPSGEPTGQPSAQPTTFPSSQPTRAPSCQPSSQPSAQPSALPSTHPSSQPSGRPSNQPTSQPSVQPSQQPRAVPTSQPTSGPSEGPTSEWAVTLNQSAPSVVALTSVNDHIWVCSATGQCEIRDAATGQSSVRLTFSSNVDSVIAVEASNSVVISGHNVSETSIISQVSICKFLQNKLQCYVSSYTDMLFLATSYVPYPEHLVHLSQLDKYPRATIFSIRDRIAQTYIYSAPIMGSVVLSHIQSPPNFVGSFVAGTGVRSAGDLSPCIILGKLRTDYGGLSAMYLVPVSGSILNSDELVNAMALEYANPDSFIVGGMQLNDGLAMHSYLIRANGLFESVSFCMRYRPRAAAGQSRRAVTSVTSAATSVARGVVYMQNALFMVVDITHSANASSERAHSVSILRILAESGEITKQVNIAARNGSFSCSDIILAKVYTTILCTLTRNSAMSSPISVVISADRELSFKKLPQELVRDDADILVPENVPFTRTVFSVTTAKAATDLSEASQPPSVAPTQSPSWQPSSAPSAQPSSSPTSAPSVSPQPTSHPSTRGPTNTYKPTVKPTQQPSRVPTRVPTVRPSVEPTVGPTALPSVAPTIIPSVNPSAAATTRPTRAPSVRPTRTSAAPTGGFSANASAPITDIQEIPSSLKPEDNTVDVAVAVSVVGAVFLGFFVYAARKYRRVWMKENAKHKKRIRFLAQEEETWAKILQRQKELLQEAERVAILRRKLKNEEQKNMFALASVLESSGEESDSSNGSKPSSHHSESDLYTVSSLHDSELADSLLHTPVSSPRASSVGSFPSSHRNLYAYHSGSSNPDLSMARFASRTNSGESYYYESGGEDEDSVWTPNSARVLGAEIFASKFEISSFAGRCGISSLHSSEINSQASSCESEVKNSRYRRNSNSSDS